VPPTAGLKAEGTANKRHQTQAGQDYRFELPPEEEKQREGNKPDQNEGEGGTEF
jgi:hypothetical protein